MTKGNKLSEENKVNAKLNLQRGVKHVAFVWMLLMNVRTDNSNILDTINGLVFFI